MRTNITGVRYSLVGQAQAQSSDSRHIFAPCFHEEGLLANLPTWPDWLYSFGRALTAMSTDPSIIFYQGLRCTKVRREPRATDSVTDTPSSILTDAPSPTETSTEDSKAHGTSSGEYTTSTATSGLGTTSSNDALEQSSRPDGIHSTTLTHSTHTTFTTETSTIEPTSSLISSVSDDGSSGPPYALIFGLLFGILGLIALVALIIFLIHRRRSRQVSDTDSLQGDRASANSRTGLRRDFRSQMSYLHDASPTSSVLLSFQPAAAHNPDEHHQNSPCSDLFSDAAAVPNVGIRILPTNHDHDDHIYGPPTESQAANRDSFDSGTSLGSTLVLPGRSSMGSEYQGTNLPSPKLPPSGTSMGSTPILPGRSSMGSDDQGTNFPFPRPPSSSYTYPRTLIQIDGAGSFGLDNPQTVVPKRSSGTIPAGFL
ncbi:hypothetical protein BDV10DRAFT_194904 [Aspergillus recurvatus]